MAASSSVAVPEVSQRVVAGLLTAIGGAAAQIDHRLVLVHGRYAATEPPTFTVRVEGSQPESPDKGRRGVRVAHATSVLGITDAWQEHQESAPADLLVVTTNVEGDRLGLDLLSEMLRTRVISVDRAEIVKQKFGAADLDPRLRSEDWAWLLDTLIAAEPEERDGGWPGRGSVLTLDAAMRALTGVRLGLDGAADGAAAVDVDALLAWSCTDDGPERFAALPEVERQGIARWLERRAGEAAPLLLRLIASGQAADAMPIGVLGAVLSTGAVPQGALLSFGALLGRVEFTLAELHAYARAVEGTLIRWIGEAAGGGPGREAARRRVLEIVTRADELARTARLTDVLAANPFLPSGFLARLGALADALAEGPSAAQTALDRLREHQLAEAFHAHQLRSAEMAVRLTRWLATPPPEVPSVADALRAHTAEWGWVDHALTLVNEPMYAGLRREVRRRRDALDGVFAGRLGAWVAAPGTTAERPVGPDGVLAVEDVLEGIAAPLVSQANTRSADRDVRPPLIIVVSGMSGAVAARLGESLMAAGPWIELTASVGRRVTALAAIPSVTAVSRAALLCGRLVPGVQDDPRGVVGVESAEKDGFAAFWATRRHTATLFHPTDVPGPPGQPLDARLVEAIAADREIVGVVLDGVERHLDHGQPGSVADWTADSVPCLPELLNAARAQGRPVVLVSGSGHVLDRTGDDETGQVEAEGVESARWRTGGAGPGEVALAGSRVLENGGRVTAAWDASLRYTPRKAGYQGGAALAEMAVPVLVLAQSADGLPAGWSVLPREAVEPGWWRPGGAADVAVAARVHSPEKRERPKAASKRRQPVGGETLFGSDAIEQATAVEPVVPAAESSLGWLVVDSPLYERQGRFVRRTPERKAVAAVIDALAEAGGKLSIGAVVAAVTASGGRAPRQPEGLITVLSRLLNIEGYDVIGLVDSRSRVSLNVEQLREQFGIPERVEGDA
ncbi:BREX-2 system phosphatase PglZ [Streptomyces mayteni]